MHDAIGSRSNRCSVEATTLYLRAPGAPRPLQAVKVITATAITGEHVPHAVDVARIPRLFGVIECRGGDLRTEKPK